MDSSTSAKTSQQQLHKHASMMGNPGTGKTGKPEMPKHVRLDQEDVEDIELLLLKVFEKKEAERQRLRVGCGHSGCKCSCKSLSLQLSEMEGELSHPYVHLIRQLCGAWCSMLTKLSYALAPVQSSHNCPRHLFHPAAFSIHPAGDFDLDYAICARISCYPIPRRTHMEAL